MVFLEFIPDINECDEGTHSCGQICHNSLGSYGCGCNYGFILDTDGQSCIGNLEIGNNLILPLTHDKKSNLYISIVP